MDAILRMEPGSKNMLSKVVNAGSPNQAVWLIGLVIIRKHLGRG